MESFIPSWAVLERRKVVWGLAVIGYCVWQLSMGNATPFQWFLKLSGGLVFVLFTSAGGTLLLEKLFKDKEKSRKHYNDLLYVSVVAYVWFVSRVV
jgi:hypothetical protein